MDDDAKQILRESRDAIIELRDIVALGDSERRRKAAFERRSVIFLSLFALVLCGLMIFLLVIAWPKIRQAAVGPPVAPAVPARGAGLI